jgi:predicted dehydrogenase
MSEATYGVSLEQSTQQIDAPELDYRPLVPRDLAVPIALIGCGGISQSHLQAYRNAGLNVVALCDRTASKAEARRIEFFPSARIYTDSAELLLKEDVLVVDITTHPTGRPALIERALKAGKHVLSQKPFVLDLAEGERLAALAERQALLLAVNQNGRWAPHFSWMRKAVEAGMIGDVTSMAVTIHWNHHWIVGTPFDDIPDLILSDFAIHWFDLVMQFFRGRVPEQIYAAARRGRAQRAAPPFLAHACVEFPDGQATLAFNATCTFGQEDRTTLSGSFGTLHSTGPNLTDQRVTLHTAAGISHPQLHGTWFPDGFQGAMAELLCAIENRRQPLNNARDNLQSLALCFAALESARSGSVIKLRS